MPRTENLHNSTSLRKYLLHYAEGEAQLSAPLFSPCDSFKNVLCIPVYKEPAKCLNNFITQAIHSEALLIVVLNQPSTITMPCAENIALSMAINDLYPHSQSHQHLTRYTLPNNSALLLVNRFSPSLSIPHRQGVGLARKIAADTALFLIANEIVSSKWIHCSDADANIPTDYFGAAQKIEAGTHAALIYPFRHVGDQSATQSVSNITRLYEQQLQHYVNGLIFAGSPYAYHTLGSTLCLSASHYAQVRGFPKRAAGEDFYILNKLRKTGSITTLKHPTIQIASRRSDRTPFGTGAAVEKLLTEKDHNSSNIFYHPSLFVHLSTAIQWLNQLSRDYFEQMGTKKIAANQKSDWKRHLNNFSNDSAATLIQGFEQLNFDRCYEHCIAQCKTPAAFNKHLHDWFDGFKTLKWIHALREADANLANTNLQALRQYSPTGLP